MRYLCKPLLLILIAAILTSVPISVNAEQPSMLADQDFTLAGIALFERSENVIEKYGEPTNIKRISENGSVYIIYDYNNSLQFGFFKAQNKISLIVSETPKISTARNITVGCTDEDMIRLYGNSYKTFQESDNIIHYCYSHKSDGRQLYFKVDAATHKILSIRILSHV